MFRLKPPDNRMKRTISAEVLNRLALQIACSQDLGVPLILIATVFCRRNAMILPPPGRRGGL
jgi:hypothetical protein